MAWGVQVEPQMAHYLIESFWPRLASGEHLVEGVRGALLESDARSARHNHDHVFLYVLLTAESPHGWPERGSGLRPVSLSRRAPPGVADWWMVFRGAETVWPGTSLCSSPVPLEQIELPGYSDDGPRVVWP